LPTHTNSSAVFARWRQCVSDIQKTKKMVAIATSLSCRVLAISAFCWSTTQTPSITNSLVAIDHAKPVTAILVPKLVAMATTLRHSISSMSSSDSLTPITHPQNQTACHWLPYNQSYSPSKSKNSCHSNVPSLHSIGNICILPADDSNKAL